MCQCCGQLGDLIDGGLPFSAASAWNLDGADLDAGRHHHCPPAISNPPSAGPSDNHIEMNVSNIPCVLCLTLKLELPAGAAIVRELLRTLPGKDILGDAACVGQAEQPQLDGHGRR